MFVLKSEEFSVVIEGLFSPLVEINGFEGFSEILENGVTLDPVLDFWGRFSPSHDLLGKGFSVLLDEMLVDLLHESELFSNNLFVLDFNCVWNHGWLEGFDFLENFLGDAFDLANVDVHWVKGENGDGSIWI